MNLLLRHRNTRVIMRQRLALGGADSRLVLELGKEYKRD